MFIYSQKDLNTIDPILEPLFARAKEHAAQTEQLAMDATRLMSVRPDQFEMSAKQPFFKRLAANFNGQTADNVNNLYEMQRIGWRYIQILNERDLMMAHSMITVKNNLMTLAVKETETRQMLTLMANKIADRFEKLEESVGRIEAQQNIHSWLLTLDTYDYPDKYPEKLRLLLIVKEFFKLKQSNWNFTEIKYLQKALKEAELPWREEITLADFIDDLIDEIEAKGFHVYDQLIALNGANGRIEQKFILENISAPSHKSLYKIADNYDASSDMIDLLADQLSISKKDAMKKVLRGFIEKEGIDTTIKIPMMDLAVELLGCHGTAFSLKQSGGNFLSDVGTKANFYVLKDIPDKKLLKAMESYASPKCGTPLILFDDTVFGSADTGLLLGSDFLYSSKNKQKIDIFDIESVSYVKNDKTQMLYINGIEFFRPILTPEIENWTPFVNYLRWYLDIV